MKEIIKSGDKFNKLTAIKFIEMRGNGNQHWLFRCECGNKKIICIYDVKNGRVKSCGCLLKTNGTFKHGMVNTRNYYSWTSMKQRCLNKNHQAYKYYGGRGIKVCEEWLNSFKNFYRDMGNRPQGKSLDRIDNNGNYCLENCQWATPKEQANNRKNSRR